MGIKLTLKRMFSKKMLIMMFCWMVFISLLTLGYLFYYGVSNEVLAKYGGLLNMLIVLTLLNLYTMLLFVFITLWILRDNEGIIKFFSK